MNHIAIFQIAKFDVKGETTDEERNQESRPEEKGCSEEKEVVGRALNKGQQNRFHFKAPVFRGLFLFARPPRNKEGRWNEKAGLPGGMRYADRKSTRLNSSHLGISYAVFCL